MDENIKPNTLKVDDNINDLHFKNKNINNLSNINNLDDFVCVFENNGIEYPKLAMGLQYKIATTKAEKKDICESKGRLSGEGLLFIKKDEWINPDTSDYECGVFNLDGTRKAYNNPTQDPRKFPSTKLCDKYYDINNGADFYTKMIPKKLDTPFVDLREPEFDKEKQYNSIKKIFFIILFSILFFTFYFIYKYELKRPYDFYDHMKKIIFNKVIILFIVMGIYINIFCPFNMCYLSNDSSLFRRDINKFMKINFCNFTKDNISNLGLNISSLYDNSNMIKNFDSIVSYLIDINTYIEKPMKYLNNKLCNRCEVKNSCILRKGYYNIKIVKPEIINYFSNNNNVLNEINNKYKYKKVSDYFVPYNSGTIIYLKSDKKNLNNRLYMCCLSMNGRPSIGKGRLNGINGYDYVYNWIKLKDRNGDIEYKSDISLLRIKMCKDSYRILSVDNNYDLLDYNISLPISTYISLFEKNSFDYTEYPFYPNFSMDELRKDRTYNLKPNFVKRKIVRIYKYHTSNPCLKFKTKNVTVYGNNIYRYDYKDSIRFKFSNYFEKYIDNSLNLLLKLDEINNYHNDDEDDNNYLSFYNTKHDLINKDFYLNSSYNLDMDNIDKNFNVDDDLNDFMYKLNLEFSNLNYIQRSLIRERITNKLLENYNKIEFDDYFIKNKNKIMNDDPKEININNVRFKEYYIMQEFKKDHCYESINYLQNGVVNQCIFCKQTCKI